MAMLPYLTQKTTETTLYNNTIHSQGMEPPTKSINSSLALQLILRNVESSLQQLRLLLHMARFQSRRHACARVTARVHDVFAIVVLGLVQQSLETRLRERPGTGIQGFLLAPDNRLGVGVHIQILLQLLPGEGVKLLYTSDCSSLEALLGTVLVQRSVDLTGTEDDAVDSFWIIDGVAVFWVGDDPLKLRVPSELLDGRARQRVSKKRFGEEENEGYRELVLAMQLTSLWKQLTFSKLSMHLSSQNVEQI
jgi:hypothetical protein